MKRFHPKLMARAIVAFLILCAFSLTAAAKTTARTDALGAHVNAGRGCPQCHAPHRTSPMAHGAFTANAKPVVGMLWGQDVSSTYAAYESQSAPGEGSDVGDILRCLSCHDGNYGPPAMMRNVVYETIPPKYGTLSSVPTLMDQESLITGQQIEDHPIGLGAQIKCGGALDWDCTNTNGVIRMSGTHSSHFAASYGFFVKPSQQGNTSVVACTTCHNPHLMTITQVTSSSASDLFPPGIYATRHFLRAPYDQPSIVDRNSNRSAQFCRQCHADKSNEMNGSSATTHI